MKYLFIHESGDIVLHNKPTLPKCLEPGLGCSIIDLENLTEKNGDDWEKLPTSGNIGKVKKQRLAKFEAFCKNLEGQRK